MAGRQAEFWDVEERLRELSVQGDPLEKLAATVDFEMFQGDLIAADRVFRAGADGRGFDPVLKFQILALQALHGLSLAHQRGPMRLIIRTIGLARAKAAVTLTNMAYNMKRWCWLDRRNLPA